MKRRYLMVEVHHLKGSDGARMVVATGQPHPDGPLLLLATCDGALYDRPGVEDAFMKLVDRLVQAWVDTMPGATYVGTITLPPHEDN